MAKRRDTKINIGTKAEQEAQSSQSLYGELFATVDRFTLHMFDVAGVPKPVVPSISEVPTAAAVDGATDYVLIYDESAGTEQKALLDDIVSATVLGTNLSLTSKGASTYVVASSTGTNVTLTASTTSLAGLMTASQFNKLDAIGKIARYYGNAPGTESFLNVSDVIEWDSVGAITDSHITRINATTFQCQETGRYKITVTHRVISNNRVELQLSYVENAVLITEEFASDYIIRDTDQNTGSLTLTMVRDLTSGWDMYFQSYGNCDGTFCTQLDNGTSIIFERVS